MFKKSSCLFFLFVLIASCVWAGDYVFYGTTDKNPLEYQLDEPMVFTVQLLQDGEPVSGVKLKATLRSDDGSSETFENISDAEKPLTLTTSISKPGFVHCNVQAFDADGKLLKNGDKNITPFDGGAGAAIYEIKGSPEPGNFDAFWAKQKARLAEVPMKVTLTEVESGNPNVLCYDVKIDCVGKPVSGYFCKPKNATEKSLPARVSFHGYSVRSSNKPTWAGNCLALDINAHGIENGQPESYYQALRDGELRGYAFNKEENADPETAYFNGMFLRIIRALEFIKAQPEWDGKNLIVSGGSQGGLQCISAAGLDTDVTECYPVVPWCLDLAGRTVGRLGGWAPEWTEALGYYDAANHAKRIRGKIIIDSGLGDYVCPPSGQMVLYNNLTCPKKLTFSQGRTHGYQMPNAEKFTIQNGLE